MSWSNRTDQVLSLFFLGVMKFPLLVSVITDLGAQLSPMGNTPLLKACLMETFREISIEYKRRTSETTGGFWQGMPVKVI